jgi:cell division protein FtsB
VTQPEAPVRGDSFRPVLGVTALLLFALLAIAALKSSRDLETARARERWLRSQITATQATSERLRLRIDRLHHDPGMLEQLAREDLGMVRPGDVVIELPDPKAPPAVSVSASNENVGAGLVPAQAAVAAPTRAGTSPAPTSALVGPPSPAPASGSPGKG